MYERSRLPVYRYIYSLMGGPAADAEDLTAETFLRAWKARHDYNRDLDSAIGWLIGIAKRLVIDNHRRNLVRNIVDLPTNIKADITIEEEILLLQQKQELLQLLTDLPLDQREILVLRYMLDWKVSEIAAHVELSENHVSVILHRTLASLRKKWTF